VSGGRGVTAAWLEITAGDSLVTEAAAAVTGTPVRTDRTSWSRSIFPCTVNFLESWNGIILQNGKHIKRIYQPKNTSQYTDKSIPAYKTKK
jgi:hypothetical protein